MAYNGLTASVAIPEVTISPLSAGQELYEASYNIPSGSSYDWSPSPPSMHLLRAHHLDDPPDHGRHAGANGGRH